jgi:hypothetical protein
MHFSRKFSLFALLETMRQFRYIIVFLVVVEEKLDVCVLAVNSTRHYIVVCNRCAARMVAKLYLGDSVLLSYMRNSNKLTKS